MDFNKRADKLREDKKRLRAVSEWNYWNNDQTCYMHNDGDELATIVTLSPLLHFPSVWTVFDEKTIPFFIVSLARITSATKVVGYIADPVSSISAKELFWLDELQTTCSSSTRTPLASIRRGVRVLFCVRTGMQFRWVFGERPEDVFIEIKDLFMRAWRIDLYPLLVRQGFFTWAMKERKHEIAKVNPLLVTELTQGTQI